MGELTSSTGFAENRLAPGGSSAGLVGPRPVARTIRTSPARAGLEVVTCEKSSWKIAGPFVVIWTLGRNLGYSVKRIRDLLPPLIRRIDGSSDMDAALDPVDCSARCSPMAPKKAPLPPTTMCPAPAS